jgi:branched-chain amino acid transport system ATP-binding protein
LIAVQMPIDSEWVGSATWPVFYGLTLITFGWISYMAANALVRMWRPWWHNIAYGLILGVANRLFDVMLFDGRLTLVSYAIDTTYIIAVMLLSFRIALRRRMLTQYPWLYERAFPLGWREKTRASPQ